MDREHPEAAPIFADTGTGVAVRVPTLRNLPVTAPFMHDGRFATLDAVLDHYERLATDPKADARLRRAPLTTVERNNCRHSCSRSPKITKSRNGLAKPAYACAPA